MCRLPRISRSGDFLPMGFFADSHVYFAQKFFRLPDLGPGDHIVPFSNPDYRGHRPKRCFKHALRLAGCAMTVISWLTTTCITASMWLVILNLDAGARGDELPWTWFATLLPLSVMFAVWTLFLLSVPCECCCGCMPQLSKFYQSYDNLAKRIFANDPLNDRWPIICNMSTINALCSALPVLIGLQLDGIIPANWRIYALSPIWWLAIMMMRLTWKLKRSAIMSFVVLCNGTVFYGLLYYRLSGLDIQMIVVFCPLLFLVCCLVGVVLSIIDP